MNDSEYLAWVEIFCQARGEGPLLWAVRGGHLWAVWFEALFTAEVVNMSGLSQLGYY